MTRSFVFNLVFEGERIVKTVRMVQRQTSVEHFGFQQQYKAEA